MGETTWTPLDDEWGIVAIGGDIGGDIQCGESWTVRYHNEAIPNAIVSVTVYPVCYAWLREPDPSQPPEYGVQSQYEYLVCTDRSDPGGTEEWSDVEYEDSTLACPDAEDAARWARKTAEDIARSFQPEWDGKPFRN